MSTDSSDVTLENLTSKSENGSVLTIPRVEFVNTNLSKDEVLKMLTPGTSAAEERALVQKLTADKISIPAIDVVPKDGGEVGLHDFVATKVDAGKVAKLKIAGFEGIKQGQGGPVSIKSGAIVVEGLDAAAVLKSLGAPEAHGGTGGLDHLTWESVDLVAPDTQSGPGKTIHLMLAKLELRGSSTDAGKKGSVELSGLTIQPAADTEFGSSLSAFGYSPLELSMEAAGDYQSTAKTMSLTDLGIAGAKIGSLTLKANFAGVGPGAFGLDNDERIKAILGGSIASVELKIVNDGLFEKALAFFAKQEGASPDAVKQKWSDMVGQMAPALLGGDPAAVKTTEAAQAFIASPKNLTISVKAKNGGLKAEDIVALGDPAAIAQKLEIAATVDR